MRESRERLAPERISTLSHCARESFASLHTAWTVIAGHSSVRGAVSHMSIAGEEDG